MPGGTALLSESLLPPPANGNILPEADFSPRQLGGGERHRLQPKLELPGKLGMLAPFGVARAEGWPRHLIKPVSVLQRRGSAGSILL